MIIELYNEYLVILRSVLLSVFEVFLTQRMFLKDCYWSWREGFMVKHASCSSREPGFNFQNLCGSSQQSLSPVPRDLATSFDIYRQAHDEQTDIQANIQTDKIQISKTPKIKKT